MPDLAIDQCDIAIQAFCRQLMSGNKCFQFLNVFEGAQLNNKPPRMRPKRRLCCASGDNF